MFAGKFVECPPCRARIFPLVLLALALVAAAAVPALAGNPNDTNPPFGGFSYPSSGVTVRRSIPITGWILDDTSVYSVNIYCAGPHNPTNMVYVGDAQLVEGARPDIEAAYPDYPQNYMAGWGYMLLTNYLPCRDPNVPPNQANGTYTIWAEGYDSAGNSASLGTRTITVDNANAVKPFGSIDTPAPGATVGGNGYQNTGWVLTPPPNYLSTCGGGLSVVVDGKKVGQPTYSQARADIAQFFPGYANSNAPGGFFALDTTAYADGVHTIQWTATDSGNNTDGIGSRYFSISNTDYNSRAMTRALTTIDPTTVGVDMARPVDHEWPLTGDQSWQLDLVPLFSEATAGETHTYAAYRKVLNTLRFAPVGSSIDASRGFFYWLAGPAFMGDHDLIFTRTSSGGTIEQVNVRINFPKPSES